MNADSEKECPFVVAFVQEQIPHDQQTNAVALNTVVVCNLVFLIVYPVSGIIFDAVGAYWLYAIALVGNVAGGLILWMSKSKTIRGQPPPAAAETTA
jgi:hypothetical protein